MGNRSAVARLAALVLTAALSLPAWADNSQDFGHYVVHFNALTTDMLSSNIARQYGIVRSKNRGMLNVVVLKKVLGATGEPVKARVSATATNLAGQTKSVGLREVDEGKAVYYLGEFPVAHEETVKFNIRVQPAGSDATYTVRFQHEFIIP
ncbi:MAG TPA: DUF4426 domain-containing protein [Gammaproteobacteria bacterium]|nr:DUF4426 domain-containing protein [Gammaproteobacteria bacterium]